MTFFFGSLLAAWEPITPRACGYLPSSIVVVPNTEIVKVGTILLLTLLVVTIGKTRPLFSAIYRRLGDLSYGFFSIPIRFSWTYYSQGRVQHAYPRNRFDDL